jgi:hypothetical protein
VEQWELEMRAGAQDLAVRYATLADTGRMEELVELFTEDTDFRADDIHVESRQALLDFLNRAKTRLAADTKQALIRHHVTTHRVDPVSPVEATGIVYYLAITERGIDHWGRYVDRYTKDPHTGRWLFASRAEKMTGTMPGSWAEQTGGEV